MSNNEILAQLTEILEQRKGAEPGSSYVGLLHVVFLCSAFPEGPVYFLAYVHIKQDGYPKQKPEIPEPDYKKDV